MKRMLRNSYREKALVVFDLDGTLARTKSTITPEMSRALASLLKRKKVAVISGARFKQYKKQLLTRLHCPPSLLANLFLFPSTATSFYRYKRGWKKVYLLKLPLSERRAIARAFREVLKEIHYVHPPKIYGKLIEDRGTQVTFSALGQDVVLALGAKGVRMKEEWTRKHSATKFKIAKLMQKRLPHLGVHPAGFTSIDVTRKGIDKAYGIRQIKKHLHVPIKDMVFIGDALYPGGNDHAVKKSGVDCVAVRGPEETLKIIRELVGE